MFAPVSENPRNGPRCFHETITKTDIDSRKMLEFVMSYTKLCLKVMD